MKKLILLFNLCILGFAMSAQIMNEYEVLWTNYDLQSNAALGNRVAVWNDGTAAFVGTMSHEWNSSFQDRGTGYNYFGGTEMGEMPEERMEQFKSGWPSIAPLGGGEILASAGNGNVNIYKREVKGEGEWTMVKSFEDYAWPRIATTHDGQYVYAVFGHQEYDYTTGTNTTYVFYTRSTDYGETWSDPVEPPLVDLEMYYYNISADRYIISTNGDRVAILFADMSTDLFYIYSEDNGETWSKQVVAQMPYDHAINWKDAAFTVETDTMWFVDRSASIAIDNGGKVHVAFGLCRFAPSDANSGYYTYWNYSNGIVYWNSEYVNEQGGHEIPFVGDWSGDAGHDEWLYNGTNGISNTLNPNRLLELAEDNNFENINIIVPDEDHDGIIEHGEYMNNIWGTYRSFGTSTMPAISIDEEGNMIIAYSTLSESRTNWSSGGEYYYRNCMVTARDRFGNWFYDAINLSDDFIHYYDEVYYVTAPTQAYNGTFWVFYSADYEMGMYIDGNQNDITENYFYAVQIDPSEIDGWCDTPSSTHNITVSANPNYGGEVNGGGVYEHGEMATLTAMPKYGYEFVSWTKNGAVVSTDAEYTFEVIKAGRYVANFQLMDGYEYQTYYLNDGWTWWTTSMEMNGVDGLTLLEGYLGENGVMIASQANGFVQNYGANGWYGSLVNINNEEMYRVKVNDYASFMMVGTRANTADHPVTIYNGWTYLGYMASDYMELNEALANLEATDGDIIKNQRAFANYYEGYGWFGSLNMLRPGEGLMYKSLNEEEVTFTYPAVDRGTAAVEVMAENLHWNVNMHDYETNMTVMAVVQLEGNEVNSANYELAAFVDGVCRGSVKLLYVEPIQRYVAFLTIGGYDNEELTFGLYNEATGEEIFDSENTMVFTADAMLGDFDNPMVIGFRNNSSVDELNTTIGVYPNPVNAGGYLTIEVADNQSVYVEIVNTVGAVVATENTNRIMVPETAGIYMLKVTVDGNASQIVKLIVR